MYLCLTFLLKALAKAEDQFKKIIEEYPKENCFCLAHYDWKGLPQAKQVGLMENFRV